MDFARLNYYLHSVADVGLGLLRTSLGPAKGHPYSAIKLCHELYSTRGEASGTAIAQGIIEHYRAMDESARIEFFAALRDEFGTDPQKTVAIARLYSEKQDEASLMSLKEALEPKRQELFRRLNGAPGGTKIIIEMRRDLLHLIKQRPQLKSVDYDIKHLLILWFNRGFLLLEQISWATPAVVLEKLIENESVHAMQGWSDLQKRLAEDRRCFAFFHPALPGEPLIFVEVALVEGLARSIEPIIDDHRQVSDGRSADTAIFYSINNCLEGLSGINFGNFLIKQVVQELAHEFPKLKRFSTLSPMPGFRQWLDCEKSELREDLIAAEELELLDALDDGHWIDNADMASKLKLVLRRLAAHYLVNVKRNGKPLDPVARFHLRNGAKLSRINWLGDRSANGMSQSAGMLVNYVYDPSSIVANHEDYVEKNVLAVSKRVVELLPKKRRLRRMKLASQAESKAGAG